MCPQLLALSWATAFSEKCEEGEWKCVSTCHGNSPSWPRWQRRPLATAPEGTSSATGKPSPLQWQNRHAVAVENLFRAGGLSRAQNQPHLQKVLE